MQKGGGGKERAQPFSAVPAARQGSLCEPLAPAPKLIPPKNLGSGCLPLHNVKNGQKAVLHIEPHVKAGVGKAVGGVGIV